MVGREDNLSIKKRLSRRAGKSFRCLVEQTNNLSYQVFL
jgi:hypothetical protein